MNLREKLANDISKLAMEKTAISMSYIVRALKQSLPGRKAPNVMDRYNSLIDRKILNSANPHAAANEAELKRLARAITAQSPESLRGYEAAVRNHDAIPYSGPVGKRIEKTLLGRSKINGESYVTTDAAKAISPQLDYYQTGNESNLSSALEGILKKNKSPLNWKPLGELTPLQLKQQNAALATRGVESAKDLQSGVGNINENLNAVAPVLQGQTWASKIKRRLGFGGPTLGQKFIESGA